MSVAARSPERPPAVSADRTGNGVNQRRTEEAFRLLDTLVTRIVAEKAPSFYLLDLASQNGLLQAVWCRDGSSGFVPVPNEMEPLAIAAGNYGPHNADRYLRAQNALATLLDELTRPGCDGSATLRIRGADGELADEIRAESRRQWRF